METLIESIVEILMETQVNPKDLLRIEKLLKRRVIKVTSKNMVSDSSGTFAYFQTPKGEIELLYDDGYWSVIKFPSSYSKAVLDRFEEELLEL